MQKKLALIKLGGSVITNKDVPMSLRRSVLKRLVKEIARAKQEQPETLFVIGHGQGSYAHVPAQKYQTMQGFVNDESRYGMAVVQDNAAQLNRIVVHEFLKNDIPAVSFYPSNSLITKNRKAQSYCVEVLEEYLHQGLFPITGGDVIVDKGQGCTIWSTEEVLSLFAQVLTEKGWIVQQIVHVTEVEGFLGFDKHLVSTITPESWNEYQLAVTKTKGFDVTGGMSLKIEESLELAKLGIESKIISGFKKDNLYNTLIGKNWTGTTVALRKPIQLAPVFHELNYAPAPAFAV